MSLVCPRAVRAKRCAAGAERRRHERDRGPEPRTPPSAHHVSPRRDQGVPKANKAHFGTSKNYGEIRKEGDFLYIGEGDFIQLGENAGMINRNARRLLHERLVLRNLCGHPTRYTPGREETVIFIESLLLNILSGSWLEW